MSHAFTVAAFLCTLVSWVALTLERAFCIDAVAISTKPNVLTLINVCLGKGEHALCSNLQNTIPCMIFNSFHFQQQNIY